MLKPVPPAPLPIRLVGRTVDWVVITIGAVMATMVFTNVCLHLFHEDLAWVTEFGELLMVWVTFLGGACAAQRGAPAAGWPGTAGSERLADDDAEHREVLAEAITDADRRQLDAADA